MDAKGKLTSIARNWQNGRVQLTFEFEQDISREIDHINGVDLAITAKQYRRKRSLDANAYYWLLLSKLADRLQVSRPYLHNSMLRKYGECEVIDGRMIYLVIPDNEAGTQAVDEAETYHIKPTSEVKFGTDGTGYRTYLMLRGSSTYNTKEMSTLINGLVEDCRDQGIETLPPEELDRMMQAYERAWKKKNGDEHEECHTE